MLVDITTIADAVRFAQRIARKMSRDPEVDSIAGEAAWRALHSYDIKRNVKLSWWIAQLTKQGVIHYWRKLSKLREREKLKDEIWWAEQALHPRDEESTIKQDDWQLLVESFVLKWPLDVIARERGLSIGEAKQMRAAAISRLEAAC
jgi:DNA-directed RNA polymerase specialized sigma subunit